MARRRSAPAPAPAPHTLEPWHPSGSLPALTATPPATGWTLDAARAAAADYGRRHRTHILGSHRLEAAAFRALVTDVPGLHRAWIDQRLTAPRRPAQTPA